MQIYTIVVIQPVLQCLREDDLLLKYFEKAQFVSW